MPIATFENPPLNEVAFGVFFAPIAGFKTSHFGLFGTRLRPDFDQTEDKQPILTPGGLPPMSGEWFGLPRVWYVHREKVSLLQLQADRFHFNWRRLAADAAAYPRFDSLEPLFERHFATLLDFLRAEDLGVPELTGAELVYTNHIPKGDGWTMLSDIPRVFPAVGNCAVPRVGELAGVAWRGTFETAAGQLVADLKTGKLKSDPDNQLLMFQLGVTATKAPKSDEDLRAWFTAANGAIVTAFLALTSPEVQQGVWRRVGG